MFRRSSVSEEPTTAAPATPAAPVTTAAPATPATSAPPASTTAAPAVTTTSVARTTVSSGSGASLAARIALTLIGAAAMIVSAFLDWYRGIAGDNLTVKSLWQTTFSNIGTFAETVGFVLVVLGLVAIVGLAFRSGWLTRLAGVLGVVTFGLFVIELYRATASAQFLPGVGAWVALAASLVTLIGGFLGTRTRVVTLPPSESVVRR
jgi:hypothetical protein